MPFTSDRDPGSMKEELTQDELQTLINIVSQVNVPVMQAPVLIALIGKMSRLCDQKRLEESAPAQRQEPNEG